MACIQQKIFAGALVVFLGAMGSGWGVVHAQSANSRAKVQPGFMPVGAQGAQVPPTVALAVGESSAQAIEAPVVMRVSKPDKVWRLSPAQRAELRDQVRRSSPSRSDR